MKSKELRAKAWESLKGKYWIAFVATLISGLIISVGVNVTYVGDLVFGINETALEGGAELDNALVLGALVITAMAGVFWVIGLILNIFIQGPAMIGECNYFIKNTEARPSLADIFSGFKTKYMRNVGIMLLINIKLFLWSILFLIPGLIKSFEYAIIPYILADDPEISSKDAFKKAREMMRGNKWRLFKLNFSFIGWFLLAILTLGIGTFFLIPYINAANAEFYAELKNK